MWKYPKTRQVLEGVVENGTENVGIEKEVKTNPLEVVVRAVRAKEVEKEGLVFIS